MFLEIIALSQRRHNMSALWLFWNGHDAWNRVHIYVFLLWI